MIAIRLGFYFLYIALGIAIIVRVLSFGLHWQIFSGIVFGGLLIALGTYRLNSFFRRGAASR